MHVNNYKPQTFEWILKLIDIPYVPGEWNVLRDRAYQKDHSKVGGTSVLGKYITKMKNLTQWQKYTYKDSEMLQKYGRDTSVAAIEERKKADEEFEQELKEKLSNGEISDAEYQTLTPTNAAQQTIMIPTSNEELLQDNGPQIGLREKQLMSEEEIPDRSKELTQQDKEYLVLKWGRMYTPQEWLDLQKNYQRMRKSFDIQDADTENTLIVLCKTYLKMNQSLDQGDLEGYQKLARVYDQQRKSAKFTAAQNKNKDENIIDAAGVLTSEVERLGGKIKPIDLKIKRDLIDQQLEDMKKYTRDLVEQDKSLAREIEDYIKELRAKDAAKRDKEEAAARGQDVVQLTDKDLMELRQHEELQRMIDEQVQGGDQSGITRNS